MNTQMKENCECIDDCKICAIMTIKKQDLMNEICCKNSGHPFLPRLNCAKRICINCKYNTYYDVLKGINAIKKILNKKSITYKGILERDGSFIDIDDVIEFMDYLCACDECITNEFERNGNQSSCCCRWLQTKPITFRTKSNNKPTPKSKFQSTINMPFQLRQSSF